MPTFSPALSHCCVWARVISRPSTGFGRAPTSPNCPCCRLQGGRGGSGHRVSTSPWCALHESPDDELKRLRERVAEQAAIIEGQTATIEQMHERIQELEVRLAKDSCNSSRPPSSDSPFKKPPPRSRRQPSGRKPGGQPGRRGVTRSLVEAPDQCVIIPLPGTCAGPARRHRDRHYGARRATPSGRGGDPM